MRLGYRRDGGFEDCSPALNIMSGMVFDKPTQK